LLDGANLAGLEIGDQLNLTDVKLRDADLTGVDLSKAEWYNVDLSNSDLTDAVLRRTVLLSLNFSNATMVGIDLSESDITESYFSEVDLSNANFIGAEFNDVDFTNATLTDAYLMELEFEDVKFRRCNLSGAFLADSDLANTEFFDANLSNAFISGSDLSDANLDLSNLSGATLSSTNLRNCNLSHTNFTDADLKGADLTGADLRGIDLSGVSVDRSTKVQKLSNLETIASNETSNKVKTWADIAQAYHELKTAFSENGMIGRARKYRMRERRARRREAYADGGVSGYTAWLGSLLSRFTTGYGVQLRWPVGIIIAIILGSAIFYAPTRIDNGLYYSIVTFVTSPPTEPPNSGITEEIALAETFIGTLYIVLLGYVLGNREQI